MYMNWNVINKNCCYSHMIQFPTQKTKRIYIRNNKSSAMMLDVQAICKNHLYPYNQKQYRLENNFKKKAEVLKIMIVKYI